jgi:hypothetical protein
MKLEIFNWSSPVELQLALIYSTFSLNFELSLGVRMALPLKNLQAFYEKKLTRLLFYFICGKTIQSFHSKVPHAI